MSTAATHDSKAVKPQGGIKTRPAPAKRASVELKTGLKAPAVVTKGAFGGRAKNIPARNTLLLPYQTKWVKDPARMKLCEKSRQIGWTWSTAYSLVARKSLVDAQLDAWISSRDDIQARLFLEDCKSFAALLDIGAKDLGERVIDDKGHSAYVLSFANALRAHSMSSNPDAQAGKRGDRVLDEFALHPDPRKLYSIAKPGITWGGKMEIFSTHRGTANFFNELITEAKEKGNPKRFSLHKVTLQDALDQGFLYKLQSKLPEDDDIQGMDEAEYFDFTRNSCADEESFLQEYMCVPGDDTTAFLSYDLLGTCLMRGADNLRVSTEKTRDHAGREGVIRRLQNLTMQQIAALPFDLYAGVDIGRVHDLTCPWIAADMAGVLVPVSIIEMAGVAFARQEEELYPFLEMRNFRRGCFDQTGIGRQFVERAQVRFGQYKVEGINFTPATKEELAYPLRAAFEDRTTRMPDDKFVISDHRAIKKEQTAGDHVRFSADASKNGHADRFWGHALCKHASKRAAGNMDAVVI